jgi:iron complex outermembrane recepter protein
MKRFVLVLSIICCMILSAIAQRDSSRVARGAGIKAPVADIGSITGKLTDPNNAPVGYATVTLLRMDSSVVNGDLTADNGTFNIAPTGIGKFRLRIESIGVVTKFINVEISATAPNQDLGKIKLTQSENTLKTTTIVGERPVMELKVDKKVFNVEKNITSAGGSASDVLSNVPSVSVDADGNVSLRGKSDVTILIDGKPATLLGTDVASALQSLPAGSIDNVEVITNPSAKYDAQGTSGIINIVTKKDGKLGMNGTFTLGAGMNDDGGLGDKFNGNFGLNVRKGKWNVFLNASGRLNQTYNNVTTDRYNKDSSGTVNQSFHTFEKVPRHQDGSFNNIGFSYDPDKNNSFTFTESINLMHFGFDDTSNYSVFRTPNETGSPMYLQNRMSNMNVNIFSLSSSLDYKHKFRKKDEELSMNVTAANTDIRRTQNYNIFDSLRSIYQTSPGTGNRSSFNGNVDFTDPLFTENGKFGIGFKTQINSFKVDGNPTVDTNHGTAYFDYPLRANYNYTMAVHAAYINWSDQVGKFGYQAGLRVEDAAYDGSGQVPNDTSFHQSFVDFFPSAFVSYKLPNDQSIFLNYSRRVNRPDFMQLLPFKDFSNPGTVNTGNPGLIPEYINSLEFSYNKTDKRGDNIIISAYYSYTQNLIQKVTGKIDNSPFYETRGLSQYSGQLLSLPINAAYGSTYGLEGTGHLQFTKFWDATLNFNFFQNQIDIGNVDTTFRQLLANNITNGFSWFGKLNTSIKLPKSFSLQINANYESPKVIAQGSLKESYWMDIAIRKNLWKNKATIILNCADVFKTRQFITNYTTDVYYETINRVKETRIVNLTFTYRFGKTDMGKGKGPGRMQPKMDDKMKPDDQQRENNLKGSDEGGDQGGGGDRPRNGGGKN